MTLNELLEQLHEAVENNPEHGNKPVRVAYVDDMCDVLENVERVDITDTAVYFSIDGVMNVESAERDERAFEEWMYMQQERVYARDNIGFEEL